MTRIGREISLSRYASTVTETTMKTKILSALGFFLIAAEAVQAAPTFARHVQQAPVFIVWAIDMSGWDSLRDALRELIEVRAIGSLAS